MMFLYCALIYMALGAASWLWLASLVKNAPVMPPNYDERGRR